MKNKNNFDVLIVYSDTIATSASSLKRGNVSPFALSSLHKQYNNVYSYFLDVCKTKNLKAAFTTTADIIGPGKCRSYWVFNRKKWIKVTKVCYSKLIFDKFFPQTERLKEKREILFSSSEVMPFSNNYLFNLFFDKLETSKVLREFSVPTIDIETPNLVHIELALNQLKLSTNKNSKDFTNEIILKDRYGAGGFHVYKIEENYSQNILKIMEKNKDISFVIQPFVKFSKGFQYKNMKGFTEIRLIYLRNKVAQMYIRVAGNKDFLCNHGNGGLWITKNDLPKKVLNSSKEIITQLHVDSAMFALDFIVSNNNTVYLLEGNISPGIDWHPTNPKNVRMNKTMIRIIVSELVYRIKNTSKFSNPTTQNTLTLPIVPVL